MNNKKCTAPSNTFVRALANVKMLSHKVSSNRVVLTEPIPG